MQTLLELTKQLIAKPSITPNDHGCQKLISEFLQPLNFSIEELNFGDVKNLWARHGDTHPLFIFAGHTDVVPPGPLEQWRFNPFEPTIADGNLYGRGTADMKSALAAMLVATQNFIKKFPQHKGSIAFLITSDEEGEAINGTVKVIEELQRRGEKINWCVIGEATSTTQLGDTIKNGRRGSLSGELTIHGVQGHIAYPQLADNPIHKALRALDHIVQVEWDKGNQYFPATSLQISNIHAGNGATNVIPGELKVLFNLRYSTEVTQQIIVKKIEDILHQYKLKFTLTWQHSGKPFLTKEDALIAAAKKAITDIVGITAELSTSGGTSDGRFIAETGCEVIEIGPSNASIHKIDEHITLDELEKLVQIYQRILEILLVE